MQPKGTLLIIGGAEDKGKRKAPVIEGKTNAYEQFEILRELLPERGKKRIEIITTASSVPEQMMRTYRSAFNKLGYKDIGFLNIEDKDQAREQRVCERILGARAVFFTGGDQFRLASILGGTDCIHTIKEKYLTDDDFVVAGTSAGAMVMAEIMIYEGGVNEALLKGDLKTSSGIGIIDTCIIDTHFIKRGRFGRLAHAVIMNPELLGIGLGEDTALIIHKGFEAECRGSGMVVIIDGNKISHTNITDVEEHSPIYVDNLVVHLLVKGIKFDLIKREMIPVRKRKNKKENSTSHE